MSKQKKGPASFARVAAVTSGFPYSSKAKRPSSQETVLLYSTQECTPEEIELLSAACMAILATVRTARKSGKYKAYAWCKETEQNQLAHAMDHVRAGLVHRLYPKSKSAQADKEPHPEHAVTRLAILLAQMRRAKKGNR